MERIEALRKIVAERQADTIEGDLVDLFSASAMVTIYEALSEKNRAKYIALPWSDFLWTTWLLVDRAKGATS